MMLEPLTSSVHILDRHRLGLLILIRRDTSEDDSRRTIFQRRHILFLMPQHLASHLPHHIHQSNLYPILHGRPHRRTLEHTSVAVGFRPRRRVVGELCSSCLSAMAWDGLERVDYQLDV